VKWYKVTTSYDGTEYYGWQVQKDLPTIASTMQDVFHTTFNARITLRGASRTDAGVHALGHVAFFSTNVSCSPEALRFAWGNALPSSITIQDLVPVAPIVHPHAHVVSKQYWYHFFVMQPSPFAARYGWYVHKKVNIERLKQALLLFVGTHDFKYFCSSEVQGDTVRFIDNIGVHYVAEYGAWRIVVQGKGFLRYMIRRIVGAAMECATSQHVSLSCIQSMLMHEPYKKALLCAPAKGLVLHSIMYKDENG